MGFEKQILLVIAALLLTIALGVHGGETLQTCQRSKDCPPCKIGMPVCTDGECSCLGSDSDSDSDSDFNLQAKTDFDCAKECPSRCEGCAYVCKLNDCFCIC